MKSEALRIVRTAPIASDFRYARPSGDQSSVAYTNQGLPEAALTMAMMPARAWPLATGPTPR